MADRHGAGSSFWLVQPSPPVYPSSQKPEKCSSAYTSHRPCEYQPKSRIPVGSPGVGNQRMEDKGSGVSAHYQTGNHGP